MGKFGNGEMSISISEPPVTQLAIGNLVQSASDISKKTPRTPETESSLLTSILVTTRFILRHQCVRSETVSKSPLGVIRSDAAVVPSTPFIVLIDTL